MWREDRTARCFDAIEGAVGVGLKKKCDWENYDETLGDKRNGNVTTKDS